MSEGEVMEQLVEYMNVLLLGVSVFFTIVSAYVVALYAFLARSGFVMKMFAFLFFTLTVAFLLNFFKGAQVIHRGLLDALVEIDRTLGLSPAGQAALMNYQTGIDAMLQETMWFAAAAFYLAILFLTFLWRPRVKADA